jgi:leader peptidase (prepilin peptidase)/N-methyltransferase
LSLTVFLELHPIYLYVLLALLGLVVGSFLNVVILRLPAIMRRQWECDCRELLELDSSDKPATGAPAEELSLAFPGSRCPHCKTPIAPWQNIPVVSFLLLRGRCAQCREAIGWRYPLVELATALVTVTVGVVLPIGPLLIATLLISWALIALTGIDIDHQLLPDDITLPLLWAGLLFNLVIGTLPLADAVIGAAAGYGLLWSIYWLFKLVTGKEGMGYGDFKLLAALGAWMGWQSLPLIILLSSAVGAVVGIGMIVLRGRDRSHPIPFGPYLAAAGWIALLWGDRIVNAYLGQPL